MAICHRFLVVKDHLPVSFFPIHLHVDDNCVKLCECLAALGSINHQLIEENLGQLLQVYQSVSSKPASKCQLEVKSWEQYLLFWISDYIVKAFWISLNKNEDAVLNLIFTPSFIVKLQRLLTKFLIFSPSAVYILGPSSFKWLLVKPFPWMSRTW